MSRLRRLMRSVRDALRGAGYDPRLVEASDKKFLLPGLDLSGRDQVILLLVHSDHEARLAAWLGAVARHRVTLFSDPGLTVSRAAPYSSIGHVRSWQISAIEAHASRTGPLDAVIVVAGEDSLPEGTTTHNDLWQTLFLHVRDGGSYIVDVRPAEADDKTMRLTDVLGALAASNAISGTPTDLKSEKAVFSALSSVAVSRETVVARKQGSHFLKLSDADANEVLPQREPALRLSELRTLPAVRFRTRARLHTEVLEHAREFPDFMQVPELHLRHYQGRIAFAGGTLMFTGATVLPDSFRWHLEPGLGCNFRLKGGTATFAEIEGRYIPRDVLKGNYYQLDNAFHGHFGHHMTEVVSRLWGWDLAKSVIPDLKVLFLTRPSRYEHPDIELDTFTAYGIDRSDICWVRRPTWLHSVVCATPMWHNAPPFYVHPAISDVWARLTEALLAHAEPRRTPPQIFVSRRSDLKRRPCRNAAEVEAFFAANDFAVVFPEDHSLPEQARLFANARVVAGFGGSGLFNAMHAQRMEHLIVLSHEAYDARNEFLFASVLGGDIHYLWSKPDREPKPTHTRDLKSVRSSWEFDFARNLPHLKRLLTSI